ncbi:MAG: hypothetical protein NTU89_04110, partial [Candidatus Dependentiae bacterium]|nr:hypothetical protein [Candidatus Dependentiae bacterium]
LNTLTLTALNDPESLKTMDLNQLRDILSKIETRIPEENKLSGFLFGGLKSGTFIKDLESLKTKVLNEIKNPRIQNDLLQKMTLEKDKKDTENRAAQREAALPGTIQGYLSDSSFESINSLPGQKPSEKFTPQNIADQKATVLESQLTELDKKPNKTPEIKTEIQTIKTELQTHNQGLLNDVNNKLETANAKLDSIIRKSQEAIKNDNQHARQVLTNEIARNKNELKSLAESIDEKQKDFKTTTNDLRQLNNNLDENKETAQEVLSKINDLTNNPGSDPKLIETNQGILRNLIEEQTSLKSKIQNHEKALILNQEDVLSLTSDQKELSSQIENKQAKLDELPTDEYFTALETEKVKLLKEIQQLTKERSVLSDKLNQDAPSKPIAPKVVTQEEKPNKNFTQSGKLSTKSTLKRMAKQ